MNVEQLLKTLQELVEMFPEAKDLPIRVIEGSDDDEDGCLKGNYWMSFDSDFEVSFTGQSGYEQSGEVRLIGRL
tara:strand:+ start:464 stop:685 length:222 start_codon:yes stop_codon:yes gene_type:complete